MDAGALIRSASNARLERLRAALAGREPGVLVLEGDRLVEDALAGGLAFELALVCESREEKALELEARGVAVSRCAEGLLQGLSRLTTSPGVMALARTPPPVALEELTPRGEDLLLVVSGVAEPGNLGALARSAEAFGARALVVLEGGVSPWNEKALRGSMGSLLRLPVCRPRSAAEAASLLDGLGYRQVRAATRGGLAPEAVDWSGRLALWIGAETGGLPPEAQAFTAVTIPLAGAVESLNVAVAGALLLRAAGRVPSAEGGTP